VTSRYRTIVGQDVKNYPAYTCQGCGAVRSGGCTCPAARRPEDDEPFATIIAPFEKCGNCGSRASESVYWNRTGGWSCTACGESDYPEAAE
jgi:hypothetical protein